MEGRNIFGHCHVASIHLLLAYHVDFTIRPKLFRGAEALVVASAGYGTMGKTVGRVG
jgi:hypothetical protein